MGGKMWISLGDTKFGVLPGYSGAGVEHTAGQGLGRRDRLGPYTSDVE